EYQKIPIPPCQIAVPTSSVQGAKPIVRFIAAQLLIYFKPPISPGYRAVVSYGRAPAQGEEITWSFNRYRPIGFTQTPTSRGLRSRRRVWRSSPRQSKSMAWSNRSL